MYRTKLRKARFDHMYAEAAGDLPGSGQVRPAVSMRKPRYELRGLLHIHGVDTRPQYALLKVDTIEM